MNNDERTPTLDELAAELERLLTGSWPGGKQSIMKRRGRTI